MDPLAYLKALRLWWWLPALCVLVAGAVAWVTAPEPREVEERLEREAVYEATHTLMRDGDEMPMTFAQLELLTEFGEFPARLAQRLDYDGEPPELIEEFTIQHDSELGTFQVTVTRDDPEEAERWADVFADEVLAFLVDHAEEERQERLEDAREHRDDVEAQLADVQQAIAARGGSDAGHPELPQLRRREQALVERFASAHDEVDRLTIAGDVEPGLETLQAAYADRRSRGGGPPIEPPDNRAGRTAAAAAVGLVVGLGLVLVVDRLDTRVRTRAAAEDAFGLPVVAEIPKVRWPDSKQVGWMTWRRPQSDTAEAFRMLRLSLQLLDRGPASRAAGDGRDEERRAEPPGRGESDGGASSPAPSSPRPPLRRRRRGHMVLVTSPSGHDGKTTAVANLAQAFAEVGQRVLCVDWDLRNPSLHRVFDLPNGPGLTDVLADQSASPGLFAVDTAVDGVRLLRAGIGSGQPWRAPSPDRATLARLRVEADVVLLDSGPALAVNDPLALMPAADAVVVIARAGRATVDIAHRTREVLHRVGAPTLGLVFNAVPARSRSASPHSSGSGGVAPGESEALRRLLRWWLQPAGDDPGGRTSSSQDGPADADPHVVIHLDDDSEVAAAKDDGEAPR